MICCKNKVCYLTLEMDKEQEEEEEVPLIANEDEGMDFINDPLPENHIARDIIIIERDMLRFVMSLINLFATIATMVKIFYNQ